MCGVSHTSSGATDRSCEIHAMPVSVRVMTRAISALILSLVLALTSHSAAFVRSGPDAVSQMVICAGFGDAILYMDADGKPTSAPHPCPDCVISLDANVVPYGAPKDIMFGATQLQATTAQDALRRIARATGPPVRGPPWVI